MQLNLLSDVLPLDELQTITDMFSVYRILGFLLIGLINAVLMIVISYRFFQAIQQCGYKGGPYLKWLKKRDNAYLTRLLMVSMLSMLGFLLVNMALSFIDHYIIKYLGFIVYFLFLAIYLNGERKRKSKTPLVLTKRMVRLMITFAVLTVLLSVLLILLVNFVAIPFKDNLLSQFRYAILCLSPIAVPYIVLLAYEINDPIERAINKKYYEKCKQALDGRPDLIKIGITGSYGKTSVKYILSKILSTKYKVLATPESYNTPMGISKTVKRLEDSHQIFVCEMGARRLGDVKEICNMVNHDIAVISGITYQHLESFGTLENVIKAKSEILGGNFKGDAFLSADNKYTVEMYKSASAPKYLAGLSKNKNSYLFGEDVKVSENGTEFTLVFGEEKVVIKTVLLGQTAVQNIILASAVAVKLGLSLQEIASAVSRLEQIPHRLELIKNDSGVFIIDDGYNSNPEGAKQAINLLKNFKGKKYVVTPGMVELGHAESGFNYKLGEMLSSVCDGVVLVGRSGSLQIREGLLSKDYPLSSVYMVKDLNEAKQTLISLVSSGDVVLFENDLPDLFN